MIWDDPVPPILSSLKGTSSHFKKFAFQMASSSVKHTRSVFAALIPAKQMSEVSTSTWVEYASVCREWIGSATINDLHLLVGMS